MTTAAVLLLVSDPRRVERDLPGILPGRRIRAIHREEFAGLGCIALLSRLRRLGAEEFVVLSDRIDLHQRAIRLQALGALAPSRTSRMIDLSGREVPLSPWRFLSRDLPVFVAGLAAGAFSLIRTWGRVHALRRARRHDPRPAMTREVCYLRTELWSGVPAGGSVAHTAGVAAGFTEAGADLFFIATSRPSLIDERRHAVHLVPPRPLYNIGPEIASFAQSFRFESAAGRILERHPAGLVYQRFDAGNHAGVILSRRYGVPLVLEYNGSEVWIGDHWNRPAWWRSIAVGLEEVNLRHADLIVVVSGVLRDALVGRGVEPERIHVQPNGVDPALYSPEVDGAVVRSRLGLEGRTVVGFVGTFGAWHGAKRLARAAVRVIRSRPETRFLFVGDGPDRAEAEGILEREGVGGSVVFTGMVPQAAGPEHLAAMDIVAAPHVRNPDGSRFFGSPTKLFEYMAMGRGIVASDLDQIGETLEHDRTAILVPPDDEEALCPAILRLVDDPGLRARLGAAARRRAVERHGWDGHVRGLIDAMRKGGLVQWS